MSVVRTDEWLANSNKHPKELCEKLTPFFQKATPHQIYFHLIRHGMYQSNSGVKQIVEQMKENNVWKRAEEKYAKLRKEWKGPDIPIFIFPADWRNRHLHQEFNGKGGLAYRNKLFLFLLPHHSNKEIEALLTHEYNHVCRMAKVGGNENEYTLLDAMILEGLAEWAVNQFVGESYQANWTTYYSEKQLEKFWQRYLTSYLSIPRNHPQYDRLLYGGGFYPKMLGYAVGFDVVQRCLKKRDFAFERLMSLPSEKIVQLAGFSK